MSVQQRRKYDPEFKKNTVLGQEVRIGFKYCAAGVEAVCFSSDQQQVLNLWDAIEENTPFSGPKYSRCLMDILTLKIRKDY